MRLNIFKVDKDAVSNLIVELEKEQYSPEADQTNR